MFLTINPIVCFCLPCIGITCAPRKKNRPTFQAVFFRLERPFMSMFPAEKKNIFPVIPISHDVTHAYSHTKTKNSFITHMHTHKTTIYTHSHKASSNH